MMTCDYAWGPKFLEGDKVCFRLWAPDLSELSLQIDGRIVPMTSQNEGWFAVELDEIGDDAQYMFLLPDGTKVPDPGSRYQDDVVEASRVVRSNGFSWKNTQWKGRPWEETIVYELHIGTFTSEGTFAGASKQLGRLAELGFTAIEIMPLAHFPGHRGWGYDGVYQYAPHSAYGTADDFRRLVDEAHGHGLMVFLDVVYNHFGPEGNFLSRYASDFFQRGQSTPWGDKIDFEVAPVRRFFLDNALYWLDEFNLDGLRLDAVDQIEDQSERHFLEEVARTVRARFPQRHVHLITENPVNGTDLLADTTCGQRLYTADWNDDFHHALHVAVTGETTGHFKPFAVKPWEHVKRALAQGYLQEGKAVLQTSPPPSAELPPTAFVHFLQNHDQIGNRALNDRLNTMISQSMYDVLTELLVLSPQIPLFFMGEEHASRRPFHFFCDYQGELARIMMAGRPKQAENFGGIPRGVDPESLADPNQLETFLASKISWDDALSTEGLAREKFVKDLLDVRKKHIIPLLEKAGGYSGTVVKSPDNTVFVDWHVGHGKTLQLRVNMSDFPCTLEPHAGARVYPAADLSSPETLPAWTTHLYVS